METDTYLWNDSEISNDTYNSEWARMTSEYKTVDYGTNLTISNANIESVLGL